MKINWAHYYDSRLENELKKDNESLITRNDLLADDNDRLRAALESIRWWLDNYNDVDVAVMVMGDIAKKALESSESD